MLYSRHKDQAQLWLALVFLFFLADNVVLYMREFLPGFGDAYLNAHTAMPYLSTMTNLCIVFSYRRSFQAVMGRDISNRELSLWAVYLVVQFAATTLIRVAWVEIFRVIMNFTVNTTLFLVSARELARFGQPPERPAVPQPRKWFLYSSAALQSLCGLEQLYFLIFSPTGRSHRSIFIEIIGIFYAVCMLKFIIDTVFAPAEEPIPNLPRARDYELFGKAYGLTNRERELLPLITEGLPYADICEKMCISMGTLKSHSHNIYKKLGVSNRVQLVALVNKYFE